MNSTYINILDKGINLSEIGIHNYAYSWECIGEILDEIKSSKLIILGGDVYISDDAELILTLDNWYYNLKKSPLDYSQSLDRAREYIYNYIEQNDRDCYFSFVLESF
ncbi:hypothetical protein EII38_09695 [Streptococcus minor]|uniref:Immunity protein 40 domain-containing protein n=1 Tax=Streptococcus minor TaxID=229549 RepID=A0A3P1V5K3_9STRE|nr:Imm40 family immunity protein [Streptococcus minor]RRD29472.1 hypothetical protein EII38_09695 [Streptococcus minor]